MNDNFNTRMILTTAVFAAVAALLVGPASAHVMDVEGGGGSGTSVTAQPTVQPGTIPYLSHGIGVDQSQFSGTVDELDPAIRTAIAAEASAKQAAQSSATSGPIPYLSHGIGVDQSLFQGEQQSLGLTGDSPITRVVGQEPAGADGRQPADARPGLPGERHVREQRRHRRRLDVGRLRSRDGGTACGGDGSSLSLGAESRPSRTPVATVRSRERNGAGPGDRPVSLVRASVRARLEPSEGGGGPLSGRTAIASAHSSALDLEVSTSRS